KAFLVEIERAYGLQIRRFENLPSGILDGCHEAIWHTEGPWIDAQWNRTHAYLTGVRRLGAKVVLTGHWGDQFLFDDAYLVDLCRGGAWREAWRHVNAYANWVDVPARTFRRRLLASLLKQYAPDTMLSTFRYVRRRLRPNR